MWATGSVSRSSLLHTSLLQQHDRPLLFPSTVRVMFDLRDWFPPMAPTRSNYWSLVSFRRLDWYQKHNGYRWLYHESQLRKSQTYVRDLLRHIVYAVRICDVNSVAISRICCGQCLCIWNYRELYDTKRRVTSIPSPDLCFERTDCGYLIGFLQYVTKNVGNFPQKIF